MKIKLTTCGVLFFAVVLWIFAPKPWKKPEPTMPVTYDSKGAEADYSSGIIIESADSGFDFVFEDSTTLVFGSTSDGIDFKIDSGSDGVLVIESTADIIWE